MVRINQVKQEDIKWLETFENLTLIHVHNLHSKLYVNQDTCLITSMNLYEYSQINNHEIGISLTSQDDRNLFIQALDEIRVIAETEKRASELSAIIDEFRDYTVRKLFNDLRFKYSFQKLRLNYEDLMNFFENEARKVVPFKEHELWTDYYNKIHIRRPTDLGKERFEALEKALKSFAD